MTTTETETPESEPSEVAPEAAAIEGPARPGFWQRPYVERYFTPIALPILVVVGLVMFVINMSRIFLAGHGETAVILGSLITVSIIGGAALLSAAPNLRSSSVTLFTAAFVVAVMLGGWLSLGASAPHEEGGAALEPEGPASAELLFVTEGLRFVPDRVNSETGVVRITMTSNSGQHTFVFEDSATLFPGIETPGTGTEDSARAFLAEAGEYPFYCTIPGHREAGMVGTLTAEGDPKVLEEELAALEGAGGPTPESEGENATP